ncbi:hypothetical protein LG198_02790 [Methylobacillus arboreus]|uniref:hypothetical protein n=1 Tax=Methylobacillus arboreus TaxID=755170 RepID=UPI001E2F3D5B|nr:hypothetical protein [Methylobacillus arboreus]MCB5189660.1 hypothetical protein [Methylobacillus arboreus]
MDKSRWIKWLLAISLLWTALPILADGKEQKNGKPVCAEASQEDKTQLEMVGRVLGEGKAYAALAFLDAAKLDSPAAKLYRAHALRQTAQFEQAGVLYQQLVSSCVGGLAYQGLGLLAEMQDQHEAATNYLKSASRMLPVDSRVRGDYGYALMMFGDNQAALTELLTAIELDGNNRLAINNLIMLMYKTGQDERATQLARDFSVSEQNLQGIREASGLPAFQVNQRQQFSLGSCYGNTQLCTGILSPQLEVVQ